MKTMPAREAKNHFGRLIEESRKEPIMIERNGRKAAVVLSPEEYETLVAVEDAYWIARAREVTENEEPLPTEEAMKLLQGFIAGS